MTGERTERATRKGYAGVNMVESADYAELATRSRGMYPWHRDLGRGYRLVTTISIPLGNTGGTGKSGAAVMRGRTIPPRTSRESRNKATTGTGDCQDETCRARTPAASP